MDFSEDARTVTPANRVAEQPPPLVARISDLDTAIDGLESRVMDLLNKIKPILHPDYEEKAPGSAVPERADQSELAHVINNSTERLESLSARVYQTLIRVEL